MTPWTLIETADNPDGMRLELLRRGPHFSIRSGGQLLMNSRVHDSEQALARLALESLAADGAAADGSAADSSAADSSAVPLDASVLVGGLGFGYTLAESLARLGPSASVTVIEVAPAVIRWNREQLGELNGRLLDDARVTVIEGDVCARFRARAARYDVILLDVDNGPRAVGRPGNAWLYTPDGLDTIKSALTPRGVLAVWSAGPEVGFSERLRAAGFDVVLHRVQSHAAKTQQRHFIWIAKNR